MANLPQIARRGRTSGQNPNIPNMIVPSPAMDRGMPRGSRSVSSNDVLRVAAGAEAVMVIGVVVGEFDAVT